ncbi:winged helix-turn-helix transcriptional regulator [Flavobacterium pectinovorum]|uniref:Transcriptional regulator n=1 Tax=Flavobacterium pectinovorum TaxID=29533 RepID=A0AB36P7P9_9FLAO|nr:helix-turn-helix domain-containing protein [Flavobacterium pectinovorum]OXB07998.1 transcriptional regulator [Flavobacterium pectinovorum]SHM79512.1 transcriptional regulator, HxlR family [Flavobacterium pectinovorum]
MEIVEKDGRPTVSTAHAGHCQASIKNVSDALYVIGGKWKLSIIVALADSDKRFTEIQRQVEGISARVLSSELKDLELTGFIYKKITVDPVLIEYGLAPYSRSLEQVVRSLSEWGSQHRDKLKTDALQ